MSKKKKPKVSFGSIYQRNGKGNYYFENRKRGIKPTSLKTKDPKEAVERSIELFGYLQYENELKQHRQILRQIEHKNEDVRHVKNKVALPDTIESYLRVLQRVGKRKGSLHTDATSKSPLSPTTLHMTKCVTARFIKWVSSKRSDVTYMHEVTPEIADEYFDELRQSRSAKTYNNHRSILHVVWSRLAIKGGLNSNPFSAINSIPKTVVDSETESKRPFSIEHLKTIFAAAGNSLWQSACRLAYETGLRYCDVCKLKRADLDLDLGFVDLRKTKTRKSSKEHVFYIPNTLPYLRRWVASLPEDEPYVYPGLCRLGGPGSRKASDKFMRFLRKCDITTTVLDSAGKERTVYGFHSFRASHATYSRSNGATLEAVQDMLGHSDAETTCGYIQENADALKRRAIAEYSALPLAGGSVVEGLVKTFANAVSKMNLDEITQLDVAISAVMQKALSEKRESTAVATS